MARARKGPAPRSDGQMLPGNIQTPGAGQPNGQTPPPAAVAQATATAGAGAPMAYGQQGALQQDAAQTQLPAGVDAAGEAARQAIVAHLKAHPVQPLHGPTQRPWEKVTAGAPMDPGPTNPMATPMASAPDASIVSILQNAAQASGSPTLQALAARMAATNQTPAAAPNVFQSAPQGSQ